MPNKELAGLASAGTLDATELVLLSQGGHSRKITVANLMKVIDALATETAPDIADQLALYDTSAAVTDKVTLANLFKVINGLTAETAPDAADEVATYGAGAGAARKVTLANLAKGLSTFVGDSGSGGVKGLVPAPAVGDTAASKFLKADATWTALPTGYPPGHLYGLTLSNNASDATNDIDIAIGSARDSGDAANMALSSGLTKQLDAAWAVGTNQGGLDSGSIGNNTYHAWLIKRSDTGVVDLLFSPSATAPTMPSNYDLKRRIGSIMRVSGAIVGFIQDGNEFTRKTVVLDVNVGTPVTATRTLSVPTGVRVKAIVNIQHDGSGGNFALYANDLSISDPGSSNSAAPLGHIQSRNVMAGTIQVWTSTSAQIRVSLNSDAGGTLRIATVGWIDPRGKWGP